MPYVCKDCLQLVQNPPHACPGREQADPNAKNMWGLPKVEMSDLNQYDFPSLPAILDQLDSYIGSLKLNPAGKGAAWPALARTLKLKREITDPGMVLILGNPKQLKGGGCDCEILNSQLPGVSYRTKHSQYRGPGWFSFTNLVTASEFFQKTGAINIMPGDPDWAGSKPATQLSDGRILVNAHSNCAAGLLVHEIIHAYGGPAGLFGEGLTDWFTLDLMSQWKKTYNGNPAYGYNVSLVDRVIATAGKERVARMVFGDDAQMRALKISKPTGKMIMGKPGTKTINYTQLLQAREKVTAAALSAQEATMTGLGFTAIMAASMVPKPASASDELQAGLPGAITELATMLIDLMPD